MKEIRALGLLSGGLDSTLAAKLLMDQGIHVEGIYISTGFCVIEERVKVPRREDLNKSFSNEALKTGRDLDIPIHIVRVEDDYLDLIRNPKYGLGSAYNPCIDCRIYMLRLARHFMEENGFDFIFTGEVVGQRPMTQMRQTQALIEKESGLKEILLRPLSAKLMPLTRPEIKGWVDREKLLDFNGRGRSRQFALAKKYGILDYPNPAGGCCYLTDPHLKARFQALFKSKERNLVTLEDLQLVKHGRHFLLPGNSRLMIGREEVENIYFEQLKDGRTFFDTGEIPGPSALFEGDPDGEDYLVALRIMARYAKPKKGGMPKIFVTLPNGEIRLEEVEPMDTERAEEFLL